MRVTRMVQVKPTPSRCIEVDDPSRLFGIPCGDDVLLTHNSVLQRDIIFGCIMRPQYWRFIGIDLKQVELSPFAKYKNVVLGIATTLEDAILALRFAQQTMMRRYAQMKGLGVNSFLSLPHRSPALMVMVDELGELLSKTKVSTDEGKHQDEIKGEATMIVSSIARLGRAAGVHLTLATQRPDADILPAEAKANLSVRVNAGFTDAIASNMILGSSEGTRVKANPKGRFYLSINQQGDHGQGFFAEDYTWLDEWLSSQGLDSDGTPLGTTPRRRVGVNDPEATFGQGDLDTSEGIDNDEDIARMRAEDDEIAANHKAQHSDAATSSPPTPQRHDDTSDTTGDSQGTAPKTSTATTMTLDGVSTQLTGGVGQDLSRPEESWDDDMDVLTGESE